MIRATAHFLLFLALWTTASAKTANFTLDNFTGVSAGLPLLTYINSSTDGSYKAYINGSDKLVDAASFSVNSGLLVLTVKSDGTYVANGRTDFILISVPANVLTTLKQTGGGSLSIDPLTVKKASLEINADGVGSIDAKDLDVTGVTLKATGAGSQWLQGKLGPVTVTSTGQGNIYLSGAVDSLMATLTGQGNVFLNSTGSPTISGSSTGMASVTYNQGSCNLTGDSFFGSLCKQSNNIPFPNSTFLVNQYTQGSTTFSVQASNSSSSSSSPSMSPSGSSSDDDDDDDDDNDDENDTSSTG